jgi:hypothetical protein
MIQIAPKTPNIAVSAKIVKLINIFLSCFVKFNMSIPPRKCRPRIEAARILAEYAVDELLIGGVVLVVRYKHQHTAVIEILAVKFFA